MTPERAIDILSDWVGVGDSCSGHVCFDACLDEVEDAIDMAIAAFRFKVWMEEATP